VISFHGLRQLWFALHLAATRAKMDAPDQSIALRSRVGVTLFNSIFQQANSSVKWVRNGTDVAARLGENSQQAQAISVRLDDVGEMTWRTG
jgi:hypothetical protein